MEIKDILSKVDHTLLDRCATWENIKQILDDGIKYGCASACIPASYVKEAKNYVDGKLAICTVIGFPNGYSTEFVKVAECKDAIANGADEIDTVINLCDLKNGRYDLILSELKALKAACGNHILKVIIETCLLNDDEKIKMCEVPLASLIPATLGCLASLAQHAGEIEQPVRPGTLYRIIGVSTVSATVAKWRYIPSSLALL